MSISECVLKKVSLVKDIDFFRQGIYKNYLERKNNYLQSGKYLAHFTKAYIALDILTKKEMWLNNVSYMNDYLEMKNGMGLVGKVVNSHPWHQSFKDALNSIHPHLFEDVINTLNIVQDRYFHTYGLCMCEFDKYDLSGNEYMWRNYASENGVAIIFNNQILDDKIREKDNNLPVEFLPMYYYGTQEVAKEVEDVTDFIKQNIGIIRQLDYEIVKKELLDKFTYAVWSLKHPQYSEEKEWRIMTNDKFMRVPLEEMACIHRDLEIIGNEPRYVYKFDYERAGFRLNDILARVIIGTCKNPEKVRELFISELATSVDDVESKVRIAEKKIGVNLV